MNIILLYLSGEPFDLITNSMADFDNNAGISHPLRRVIMQMFMNADVDSIYVKGMTHIRLTDLISESLDGFAKSSNLNIYLLNHLCLITYKDQLEVISYGEYLDMKNINNCATVHLN